jgi:hypothetical protein
LQILQIQKETPAGGGGPAGVFGWPAIGRR